MRNVLIALLALSLSAHAAKTTLTGSITDAQGNPLNGTLSMKLPVPAQDPTTQSAIQPTPVFFNVVNGQITGGPQLYDLATIQPNKLWYQARAYDTANNLVFYGNYFVTGATFNLGAATPTTVTTSNISYFNPQQFNTTVNVATFSGADICAKINAAALANPGSILDARSFTGTQNCASNPFASLVNDVILYLGDQLVIQTTAPWVTQSANNTIIYGAGRGTPAGLGTVIRAVTGFPATCDGLLSGCPILRLGSGSTAFGHRFENAALDCNGIAGCIGAYSTDIQEQSGFYHFAILNFSNIGLLIDGTGNAGSGPFFAENYEVFDGEIYSLSQGAGSTVCAKFLSQNTTNNGPRQLQHVTCSGTSGNRILAGFIFDGTVGKVEDLNSQFATTAYQFGGTNPVHDMIGLNLQCEGGTTGGKCVWVKNPGTGTSGLFLDGILNGGVSYPVSLQDDTNGSIQYTDFFIGMYMVDNGNTFRISTANTPHPSFSALPELTLNWTDDSENFLTLNSGKTAQQGDVILFQDRGTTKFNIEYPHNATNFIKIFDNTNAIDRFRASAATNGQTFLNSVGTGAILFNNDATSSTGGISVCNGGTTCNFSISGAGVITDNAAASFNKQFQFADHGSCTMAAGTCTAQTFPSGVTYASAPSCWVQSISGTQTGILRVSSTTTTVTPFSTVNTDVPVVTWFCIGN